MTGSNLEQELKNSEYITQKCRDKKSYAQNLYAALCDMQWQKEVVFEILQGAVWRTSWRGAGRIISEILQEGDYMDWYCSGMAQFNNYDMTDTDLGEIGYVRERTITDEIRKDLRALGWYPVLYES